MTDYQLSQIKKVDKEFVIPKLYPKQLQFCQSTYKMNLYGGARGGGKSYVSRIKAIQLALIYPGISILFLRKTLPELKANHFREFETMLYGIAKFNQTDNIWRFPKQMVNGQYRGSTIQFGYCDTTRDIDRYQGQNYDVIFMDEATHFTEEQYRAFTTCLRLSGGVDPSLNFKPRMYLTANPGGVGHLWVKRLFIDKKYREGEDASDYFYIKALVYDNEFLMANNPDYIKQLEALPPKLRQAMLYGDWDVFEGQFFDEFDETIHTYDPKDIKIEQSWRIYRARDYGLDKTACYWIARDSDGTSYVFRELWESNLSVSASGNKINQMTKPDEDIYLDIVPPDLWNRQSQTGKSAVDILVKECNQYPTKANNDREIGWLMVKEMLKVNPITGKPFLIISQDCPHLIESLKMIQHDENKPNDCAKEPHEITHSADAIRYYCTSWTFAPDTLVAGTVKSNFDYGSFALEMGEYEHTEKSEDYIEMGSDGWFI